MENITFKLKGIPYHIEVVEPEQKGMAASIAFRNELTDVPWYVFDIREDGRFTRVGCVPDDEGFTVEGSEDQIVEAEDGE